MGQDTGYISRSLDDYLVIPGRQIAGIGDEDVSLGLSITDGLTMNLGWFSAAMQCVSGDDLGVALAPYGGCVTLPRSFPVEYQVGLGKGIKKAKAGFNYSVITVLPTMQIGELMELQRETGYSIFPVVDIEGKLAGLITEKKYHSGRDAARKVSDRMIPISEVVTLEEGADLEKARETVLSQGLGILPVIDDKGVYKASVFWKDIRKAERYPDEFVDSNGRYRFAGALSTFPKDIERAEALHEADCDIFVVDTSDLKSDYGGTMIGELKRRFPEVPLITGNVIDGEGFLLAVEAGADVVKIGQGPGFGCTTREVKRTGRGQATAIQRVAAARDEYSKKGRRIPIIADGGIEHTGHMIIAYALGADGIMMGKYFGEYTESAAPLVKMMATIDVGGRELIVPTYVKEYWGEASARAAHLERYGYSSGKNFVPEGAEGVIPHRGSIHDDDGIGIDIAFLKKTLRESGAKTPQGFSRRVRLEVQSSGSRSEGKPKL